MKAIRCYKSVSISMFIIGGAIALIALLVGLFNRNAKIPTLIIDGALGVGAFAIIGVIFLFVLVIKFDDKQIIIKPVPWSKGTIINKDDIQELRWNVEAKKPFRGRVYLQICLKKTSYEGYKNYEITVPSQQKLGEMFLSHKHLIRTLLK